MKLEDGYYIWCPVCETLDETDNFAEIWYVTEERVFNPETKEIEAVEGDGEFDHSDHSGCGNEFEERLEELWVRVENGKIVDYSDYLDEEILKKIREKYELEVGE